jgi:hypothetical protein
MGINHWSDILLQIYILVLCFTCLLRLFRGKVFFIKGSSVMLNLYFVLMLLLLPDIFPYNTANQGYLSLSIYGTMIIILTVVILLEFNKLQRQILFLGINENDFIQLLKHFLLEKQIEYKVSIDEIIFSQNPEETYIHRPFLIGTGTFFLGRKSNNPKGVSSNIFPLIESFVQGSFLNWSGKILLCVVILFSISILLV